MKCENYQDKITDWLAVGDGAEMPCEIRSHCDSCQACKEFYEAQFNLFSSIDVGVRTFVNQPVPALLYNVPITSQDSLDGSRLRMPAWSFCAIAAIAVALLAITTVRNHSENATQYSPQANRSAKSELASAPQTLPIEVTAPAVPVHKRTNSKAMQIKRQEESLQVIVLPEEREAFARFVAQLPEERSVAVALTRPAASLPGASVEISLLQVNNMELKPLEGTPRE